MPEKEFKAIVGLLDSVKFFLYIIFTIFGIVITTLFTAVFRSLKNFKDDMNKKIDEFFMSQEKEKSIMWDKINNLEECEKETENRHVELKGKIEKIEELCDERHRYNGIDRRRDK